MKKWFDAEDVRAARERIAGHVRQTPLEESIYLSDDDHKYFFKLESQQLGKSFKIRGALNTISQLSEFEMQNGVGTVSTGNHGVAVAMAAHALGIRDCAVVVPMGTPQAKTDRIRYYGARSMNLGADYDEALTLGINYIDCAGMFYLDPFEHDPRVYAGQGTIGLEVMEQLPACDTIVVPIGGGGLVTGIAVAAKSVNPDVRIVGVQTAACPAMVASLRDHTCYSRYPTKGETVCEAVVGGVGEIAVDMLPDLIDDIIVVSEESIRSAFKFMIEREQLSVEAGSAMVVAAVRDFPEQVGGSNVALVISGGNLDRNLLCDILTSDED